MPEREKDWISLSSTEAHLKLHRRLFCYELKLVIEIDGASHFSAEAQKRDAERDRQMQAIGLRIIRVLDSDVRKNPESVVQGIMEQLTPKEGREVFL